MTRIRLLLLSIGLIGLAGFAAIVVYFNLTSRTQEGVTDQRPQAVSVRDILVNPMQYQGKLVQVEGVLSAVVNGKVAYFLNDQGASVFLSLQANYDARSFLGKRVAVVGVVEVQGSSIQIVVTSLNEIRS